MSVDKKSFLHIRKKFLNDRSLAFGLIFFFFLFFGFQSVNAKNSDDVKENDTIVEVKEGQEIVSKDENIEKNIDKEKFNSIKKILKEKSEKKEDKNFSDKEPVDTYLFQILRSLGIVIGILFIILYVVKKFGGVGAINHKLGDGINILERKNLTSKSQILLVSVKKKNFLVGVNTNSIAITKIDDEFESENFDDVIKNKEEEIEKQQGK